MKPSDLIFIPVLCLHAEPIYQIHAGYEKPVSCHARGFPEITDGLPYCTVLASALLFNPVQAVAGNHYRSGNNHPTCRNVDRGGEQNYAFGFMTTGICQAIHLPDDHPQVQAS